MYSSVNFTKVAKIMNTEFLKFHGETFSAEDKIFNKLMKIVCNKQHVPV